MSIPFQATHTADDGRYYMVDECEWFYANHMGHWKRHWSGAPAGLKAINQQKNQWSGPEDGLPPVGTVCEVREPNNYSAFEDWSKCTISAHNIGSNGRPQVCAVDDRGDFAIFYPEIDPVEFRAIPSAADLRETAIRELMDIAQVDCRVTAARLVDAGFKR